MSAARRLAGRVRRAAMGQRVYVPPRESASRPTDRHSPHLVFDTGLSVVAEAVRDHVRRVRRGRFLDVGGGVGAQRSFAGPLDYWVLDLEPRYAQTIVGDICECPQIADASFDVVFSQNAFEHLAEPWRAAAEIGRILKPGGLAVTLTWFAIRYHPVPADYWRFSHSALELLFEKYAGLATERCGYDLRYRRDGRNDKLPGHLDRAPVDELGGWMENWAVYHVGRKP